MSEPATLGASRSPWPIVWTAVAALILGAAAGLVLANEWPLASSGAGPSAASGAVDDSDTRVQLSREDDPLQLGVRRVNRECTGETLLVVGRGQTAAQLEPWVADNPEAQYLETAESCPTFFYAIRGEPPKYILYLGPYADKRDACGLRMTPAFDTKYVTRLVEGNANALKCPCLLSVDQAPVLRTGAGDPTSATWTLAAEEMLKAIDLPPASGVNRIYDEDTATQIRALQTRNRLVPTGVIDRSTWLVLRKTTCPLFDS